jgi:hypothetical protein
MISSLPMKSFFIGSNTSADNRAAMAGGFFVSLP